MARNVEIKARVANLAAIEAGARAIATAGPTDIAQDDTFYRCERGRLKLRRFEDGHGELSHYDRADAEGPKLSDYVIAPTAEPARLHEALSRSNGVLGRVIKRRRLYLADQTRIHLDRVEGLGDFVELEVVLRDGESEREGEATAHRILRELGIDRSQLVRGAYFDLLTSMK